MQTAVGKPIRVLLVDDHRDTREMYALALEFRGIAVRCGTRSADVLAMIDAERRDIVITDLHLAGESGLDLAYRIVNNPATRSLPVVLLTGDTRHDLGTRAKAAGCAAVAIKPMMPNALAELIMSTVAVRRSSRTHFAPWALRFFDPPFIPPGHPVLSRRGFLPIDDSVQ